MPAEPRDRQGPPSGGGHDKTAAVELVGVTKRFGPVTAVRELSLPIRRGEVVTLLGPSGCGKTTLLNMIAGFEEPSAGHVLIDGRDVTDTPPYLRDTGMVFQSYALFPHMNVFDNVAFGPRMRKLGQRAIASEVARALEMVKLGGLEERRVRQLSGGQQQRVALARAIVIRPKVLLLDEPLSALDKNLRAQMQIELKELHEKIGLTTVFVTHDQLEALSLSDRIVVMHGGEIQQISTPIELYRHPANSFVASFVGEINRLPPARYRARGRDAQFELTPALSFSASGLDGPPMRDGQLVHIFVRPEHLAIAEPGAASRNRVKCRVVTHVYQGTHTLTRVDGAELGILQLRIPGGEVIERMPVGAEIEIAVNLDHAVMLAE